MHAMAITAIKKSLEPLEFKKPEIRNRDNDILIKINACAVCHTDIDEQEGRFEGLKLPVIPGHQIAGYVIEKGKNVKKFKIGERAGIGWINSACGKCYYCKSGFENLCPYFVATGRDVNGGYAEYISINENYAIPIPDNLTDEEASPLLCAGAVGYRALILSGIKNGMNLGFVGFGASNHLVLKIARKLFPDSKLFVFARSKPEQQFALELGAFYSSSPEVPSPEKLNAIIDTTPAWAPMANSLKNLASGGRLIINAIRKDVVDKNYLTNIDYERDLWMEKEIKSIANVTRKDIEETLAIASKFKIKPEFQTFSLENANAAIREIKEKKIKGAKVLKIG